MVALPPTELLAAGSSSCSGLCLQAWTWVLPKQRQPQPSLKLLEQPSFWLRRSSQVRTCSLVDKLAQLQGEHTAGLDAASLAFRTHKMQTLLHDNNLHLFPLQVGSRKEALKGPRQKPRPRAWQPLSLWSRK